MNNYVEIPFTLAKSLHKHKIPYYWKVRADEHLPWRKTSDFGPGFFDENQEGYAYYLLKGNVLLTSLGQAIYEIY